MLRIILTAACLTLPAVAYAQEALYKSYMEAAGKSMQAGEWKEVEKMAKLAEKEAAGFKADDPRRTYPGGLLAGMYRAQSRYPEAIEVLKKNIEVAEALGANNYAIAVHAESLGFIYLSLGRPDLAEPPMRQVLKVMENQPKAENWRLAFSLKNVARCQVMSGKHEEAEIAFKQCLKLLESEPTRGGQVCNVLIEMSRMYLATDRATQAEALTKLALEKMAEVKGGGIMLARAQFVRGDALLANGKAKEAAEMYKAGLAPFTTDLSQTDSPDLIPVLTAYAKLLRADKKVAEATKLETRAADLKVKLDKGREALPK